MKLAWQAFTNERAEIQILSQAESLSMDLVSHYKSLGTQCSKDESQEDVPLLHAFIGLQQPNRKFLRKQMEAMYGRNFHLHVMNRMHPFLGENTK